MGRGDSCEHRRRGLLICSSYLRYPSSSLLQYPSRGELGRDFCVLLTRRLGDELMIDGRGWRGQIARENIFTPARFTPALQKYLGGLRNAFPFSEHLQQFTFFIHTCQMWIEPAKIDDLWGTCTYSFVALLHFGSTRGRFRHGSLRTVIPDSKSDLDSVYHHECTAKKRLAICTQCHDPLSWSAGGMCITGLTGTGSRPGEINCQWHASYLKIC